jgi:hypothetical protein
MNRRQIKIRKYIMRALMFIFESINIYFGWFCARSSEPKPIKQGRRQRSNQTLAKDPVHK